MEKKMSRNDIWYPDYAVSISNFHYRTSENDITIIRVIDQLFSDTTK